MTTPKAASGAANGNPLRESRLNYSQDFRPEWDVTTLNAHISDSLVKELLQIAREKRTEPDPARLIQVVTSNAGYGKTHLFGRIGNALLDQVFFVYVPGVEDTSRPLEHIRWHVVESLYRPRPGRLTAIEWALLRLLYSSFRRYLEQFSPSLAERYNDLVRAVQTPGAAPKRVAEIIRAVRDRGHLAPFLRMADSIAAAMPHLPGPVLRALALGWSPAADQVRRWLRGEALPEEDLKRLGLPNESPTLSDVLKAIAAVFSHSVPTVICCDQLESLLKDTNATRTFGAQVMEVVQAVPNLVLVLACVESEWPKFTTHTFESVTHRLAKPVPFRHLGGSEAVELLAKRLRDWHNTQAGVAGKVWPFDEQSIVRYADNELTHPRALIQRCCAALDEWEAHGRVGVIRIDGVTVIKATEDLFLEEWNSELESLRTNAKKSVANTQEARLFNAIQLAVTIARDAGMDCSVAQVREVQADMLRQGGKSKRYALRATMAQNSNTYSVVLPVTKMDHGVSFRAYYDAIEDAMAAPSAYCVLVHEKAAFAMGNLAKEAFEKDRTRGKLRFFAFQDHRPTFERLECLYSFYERAGNGDFTLDGKVITPDQCKELAIKTKIVDGLDLLQMLGDFVRTAAGKAALSAPEPPVSVATPPVSVANPPHLPPAEFGGPREASVPEAPVQAGTSGFVKPAAASPAVGGDAAWVEEKQAVLVEKLEQWGQPVEPDGFEIGPAFARLRVRPAGSKTSLKRIADRAEELKVALEIEVEPIIASQAGYYSIDVKRPNRENVTISDALKQMPARDGQPIFPVGLDVAGKAHGCNLSEPSDCHLLVAGVTGSGKSEFLKAILAGLAARLSPDKLQLILVDPKRVTFNFGGKRGPYLLHPVAYEPREARPLIKWCVDETKRRYTLLQQLKLSDVSQLKGSAALARVVVVIDEFANLMVDKEATKTLSEQFRQIGSLSRAAGIHLILATQRPDKDVVTPQLRDNLPGRIALNVASKGGSEIIIGTPDAQFLLGKGDLLWKRGAHPLRLQSPFVRQDELEHYLKIS